ncbi:MAG TPA: phospholipase D-like domain-containing protein, partial [Mycobacterium sp.]
MTAPIAITFLRDKDHGGDAGQPQAIARQLAGFIETASTSMDIAIYDFRLSDALAAGIVDALIAAADRGVAVRIGYDAGKPVAGTAADFLALQADPAPVGTATWVTGQFAGTAVQTKAIQAGSHLMHSKYVLRGGGDESAAVWTGS